jgi:hypothetical protein
MIQAQDAASLAMSGATVWVGRGRWPIGKTGADGRLTVHVPAAPLPIEILSPSNHHGLARLSPSDVPEPVAIELEKLGEVYGRVTDRERQQGVAGAVVWLRSEPATFRKTDSQGRYQIPASASGSTAVVAVAAEHFEQAERLEIGSTPVTAPTLALYPMACVAGDVVGPNGRPLSGVEILVYPDPARRPRSFYQLNLSGGPSFSAEQGRFTVAELLYDVAYKARFRQPGVAVSEVDLPIVHSDEPPPAPIRVELGRGAMAFGAVLDDKEAPVSGALIPSLPRVSRSPPLGYAALGAEHPGRRPLFRRRPMAMAVSGSPVCPRAISLSPPSTSDTAVPSVTSRSNLARTLWSFALRKALPFRAGWRPTKGTWRPARR